LLAELYDKTHAMLKKQLSGEELLYAQSFEILSSGEFTKEDNVADHLELMNDMSYLTHYSQNEINLHVEEIEKGSDIAVFFKNEGSYSNITVITRDSESLMSKLCGALSINDLNIHDAKIFTRKDGIVIDSFSVTDFRTHDVLDDTRYKKIEKDLEKVIKGNLQISSEFNKVRSKWWRLESKLFSRKGKVKIEFEEQDRYTIIDVFSPDRLGLLYKITKKMYELGLSIYFAKISTKADDVADAFYTLTRSGEKISSNDYELIRVELTDTINQML
jgi:[protein-PII] uridylyltransferase